MPSKGLLYLFFFLLIAYLLINTGLVSDDITYTFTTKTGSFLSLLNPYGGYLSTPVGNYAFRIWCYFFHFDNLLLLNILKIGYICLSFYLISKFFALFFNNITALFISFLFLFFPSHDATTYWFLGQYLTFSMAFYLYAYYLVHRNRPVYAFIMATLGSFISYGSPSIAIALFIMCLCNKDIRKGLVLLIPNILYSVYYVYVTKSMITGVDRIPSDISVTSLAKHFVFQCITFIDAACGPSMLLKIYYALKQLSPTSFIIGALAVFLIYKSSASVEKKYELDKIASFSVLTFIAFLMFAMTNRYPQVAFNLGNRTTIFGSLLVTYLIVLLPSSRAAKTVILSILLFSILGISDHWKGWCKHQEEVVANITHKSEFNTHIDGTIYVSGNQYSRFGPISHIEFLSEDGVTSPLFEYLTKGRITAKPINKRHIYESGCLIDTKYDERMAISDSITIYDSERDKIMKVRSMDINAYIHDLPSEYRHWIQLVKNKRIRSMVLDIMPKLKYIFQ